jgi:polyisoprenoid-binding protein YceI
MRSRFAQLRRKAFPLMVCTVAQVLFAAQGTAQEKVFTADPAQSHVEFTLSASLHTVHGTFRLKSGTLRFNTATGVADGQLVVDAESGDSGNQSRDGKMKKEILETQKYPEIVFTAQRVKGTIAAQGKSQVELDGIMVLHGQPHPMELTVPIEVIGGVVSADVPFEVPYVKWGLKNPSTFILRVSDKVQITVHMVGRFSGQ